ncbi:LOW QUALITY PROTEIN: hypothetical protein T265_13050 [Opisthorchis viverrini]|uniref:Uncharacterized protein n=1 Tax=Opisthorchis viverrini TaxID=6198 RepID=A0A075AI75_OPIVI|nr:LOW QUALITY PROTEIN: hypothetical protein T265_13050 [Opisthorchis viverrini]KER31144.1 LOW QUALITY PROTEIN: hypothetical protein T265_13050 [Opisthorchis viverrini]
MPQQTISRHFTTLSGFYYSGLRAQTSLGMPKILNERVGRPRTAEDEMSGLPGLESKRIDVVATFETAEASWPHGACRIRTNLWQLLITGRSGSPMLILITPLSVAAFLALFGSIIIIIIISYLFRRNDNAFAFQHASTVIELSTPSVSTRFRLRASSNPEAYVAACAAIGIVLRRKYPYLTGYLLIVASVRFVWPVETRLLASLILRRLMASREVLTRENQAGFRPDRGFVDHIFTLRQVLEQRHMYRRPTILVFLDFKDRFYDTLNVLLRRAKSPVIVVVAGDMNAQVGRLSASETQLGGRHGLDLELTDNGERLLQLCVDRRLFLCSTNFRNSRNRLATWCPPTAGRPQAQIDHIAFSYQWSGLITHCRSFWNTFVGAHHALVRSHFSLLTGIIFNNLNPYLDEIATALHSAGNFACGTTHPGALKHWISDRTVALLKSRRNIPAGPEHNPMRRVVRRQVKVSLRSDREVWWTQKAKEMEEAQKAGNARILFQLIRATGPRKPPE